MKSSQNCPSISELLQTGEAKLSQGSYELAIQLFTQVLEQDTRSLDALRGRGRAYCHCDDFEAAVRDFSSAVELHPTSRESYIELATVLKDNLSRTEDAVEVYSKLLNAFPQDADCLYNRAHCLHDLGDLKGAIADFTSAIKIKPTEYRFYTGRGSAALTLGDYSAAITDFDKAIDLESANPVAFFGRGSAHFGSFEFHSALKDFTMSIEISPHFGRAYLARAETYGCLEQWDNARADYTKAIANGIKNADVYKNRGECSYILGDVDSYSEDLNLALHESPESIELLLMRAEYNDLYGEDGAESSLNDYLEVLRIRPNHQESLQFAAESLLELDRSTEALQYCNQLTAMEPTKGSWFELRGRAYAAIGDAASAIADFDTAILLSPNDHSAYAERGKAYFELGQARMAVKDLTQAIELDEDSSHWKRRERGRAFAVLNNHKRAIEDFSELLTKVPNCADAYFWRGYSHYRLGDADKAERDRAKAIELDSSLSSRQYESMPVK